MVNGLKMRISTFSIVTRSARTLSRPGMPLSSSSRRTRTPRSAAARNSSSKSRPVRQWMRQPQNHDHKRHDDDGLEKKLQEAHALPFRKKSPCFSFAWHCRAGKRPARQRVLSAAFEVASFSARSDNKIAMKRVLSKLEVTMIRIE